MTHPVGLAHLLAGTTLIPGQLHLELLGGLESLDHSRTAHFHLIVDLRQHFFLTSLSHSIVWNTLQDLCNLKNARELIGRDLLQGITGLCHIDRGAPTSPCILRGLAMYRGYIAHRVSLAHIAHIGAHIDILPSILCVYQYSTYLLYIANLVCISHHIRKSGIILPSYRFYIYITWYVVTCPHITG